MRPLVALLAMAALLLGAYGIGRRDGALLAAVDCRAVVDAEDVTALRAAWLRIDAAERRELVR